MLLPLLCTDRVFALGFWSEESAFIARPNLVGVWERTTAGSMVLRPSPPTLPFNVSVRTTVLRQPGKTHGVERISFVSGKHVAVL